jgi:hypothetical protein
MLMFSQKGGKAQNVFVFHLYQLTFLSGTSYNFCLSISLVTVYVQLVLQ